MVKRLLLSLALLAATCLSLYADELTVNDGSATSTTVPADLYNCDASAQHNQFLVLGSELAAANGKALSEMKFYVTSAATKAFSNVWTITLVETDLTALTSTYESVAEGTVVYTGTIDWQTSTPTIVFDTEFLYGGRNLIVDFTYSGSSTWQRITFNGAALTDGAIYKYGTLAATGTLTSFSPKTTFTYAAPATCKKPASAAVVSGITTTGATLTWGAAEGATTYEYAVVAAGTDVDWTAGQQVNTTSATLTGLTPATAYDFYVRNYCSADDQSASFVTSFTTECEAVTEFPWSEDFEGMTANTDVNALCWNNEHVTGGGASLFKVATYSYAGGNNTNMLQLPDMSSGTITRLELPLMSFPEGNAYIFSIDVFRNASGSSYTAEGVRIFAGTDTLGFISRNYTVADGTRVPAESASGWYTYEFIIPQAGDQHIVIQGESKYGSATYMDNLYVERIPTCLKVSDIHVVEGSATQTGATIAWTPGTAAPQYKVVAVNGTDTIANTTVNEAQYTFEGLTPGHRYSIAVSVQALCSEEDNSKAVTTTVSFDTECAKITALPWSEGFEDFATGFAAGAPVCWDVLNFNAGTASTYPTAFVNTSATYVHSGSKSLYMQSGKKRHGIVILPEITADLSRAEIAFWYRNEGTNASNGTLQVGYITDIADSTTFVALQTLERINTMTEVLQSLAEVPAGARLAFNYIGGTSNNYYLGIDDITVRRATTCFKPSNIHAVDSLATTTSVTLAWSAPVQGAAQYRVTITKGADTLVNNVLTADTFCVIENLTHSTAYRISATINSVCDEDDESEAITTALVATTACDVITTFPWNEDFEAYASGISANKVTCFSTFDVVGNANDWQINTSAHNSSRSLYCRYTSSSLGRTVGAVELPEMRFENGYVYTINYWLKGSNSGDEDIITVYLGDTVLHTLNGADDLGSSWHEFTDTIVGKDQVAQLGFTFSNLDGYYVYLDDITVDYVYNTVTFLNFDSTELQSSPVAYGAVPVYEGVDPVKPATAQYTYTFKGWSPTLKQVMADAVYTAQFDSVLNEYLVVFQNYDGTVLQSTDVAYGFRAVYEGAIPAKSATAQYTYRFVGWDVEPTLVEGPATYTAQYDSIVNEYTVTFKNEDGTVLETNRVAYGSMPELVGQNPVKPATAQYTYTFTGWSPALAAVVADAEYTAQYSSVVNEYLVLFKDWDGVVWAAEKVAYGSAATRPSDPTREGYVFTGWDVDFSNITGPLTVTAQYERSTALDNLDATKAVKFIKDGQIYIRRGDELFDATGRKVE